MLTLVPVLIGIFVTALVFTGLIWWYELGSDREAPFEFALLVLAVVLSSWTMFTGAVVAVAFVIQQLI